MQHWVTTGVKVFQLGPSLKLSRVLCPLVVVVQVENLVASLSNSEHK